MRIRMLTTMAGPDGSARPGQVLDMDKERAVALLEGGYAETVKTKPETATAKAPEQTVTRGPEVSADARKLAEEHGIHLADIIDTGTDGKIGVADVRRYLMAKGT